MIPSKSTPNLNQSKSNQGFTSTAYHRLSQRAVAATGGGRDDDSPPPAPPVRDSSTLKSIKYGPGHEKFPSWPVPAAAETPPRTTSGGGSTRSKSWTDHTNYPKEKVITYTRPYMKRQHSQYTQQKLKTVMERCEKIPPETFESRHKEKIPDRLYLPNVDHDGKPLGDADYSVPSPPEREYSKPQLTQKDLEEYARSYQEPVKFNYETPKDGNHRLTESGLEEFMEYNRSYEESLYNSMNSKHENGMLTHIHHQKQVSYAQSEGYHSYVSSTDSTSTPFLDRLRRDSEAVVSRPHSSSTWEEESSCSRREGRESVVTNSSGSASSSETLKWHGSMSDVSVASSSCTHQANQSSPSSRQLIAHSARVQTPQRHHSESVLYMSGQAEGQQEVKEAWPEKENRNNSINKLKLFPVNTYTVQDGNADRQQENSSNNSNGINNSSKNRLSLSLQSALSVADRISELEKQQKYSYLDPNKKHKVPDPTLKAIQKKALLSFYERHQQNNSNNKNTWRSEPQLAQSQQPPLSVPKPLSPKVKASVPSRRASSASDYASANNSKRGSLASSLESKTTDHIGTNKIAPRHQHSNSCGSLSTDLLGPIIVGPSISVDDYVPEKPPERPPKNPNLRAVFPDLFQEQRVPSPDLPPPSPPTVLEHEVFDNDDPLPPPPPECESSWQEEFNDRLKANSTSGHQIPQPQVQKSSSDHKNQTLNQNVGIPERSMRYSLIKTRPTDHIIQQVSSKPYQSLAPETKMGKTDGLGFPGHRGYPERSSVRYPPTQKLVLNENIAVSQKVNGLADQHRPEPLKPIHREEFKKQAPTPAARVETHRAQRASIAESPTKETPPPLQPRHMRINQSMRAKISHDHRSRMSPPKEGLRETRSSSLSQSKASYLASRRDRELIVSDSESGSYKRTMSPNGHALSPEVIAEPQRTSSRETVWPLIRPSRDGMKNNSNMLRKPAPHDKAKNSMSFKDEKCDKMNDLVRTTNSVLPDVLPVNAKMIPRSPQSQYSRPTHLNFSAANGDSMKEKSPVKSPPSSPPKSPSRNSPFAPLRTTALSSPSCMVSSANCSPVCMRPSPPITSTPTSKPLTTNSTTTLSSSQLLPRDPPHIKASLSPVSSPIKLSPLRSSPPSSSSVATTNTSLHISKPTQNTPPPTTLTNVTSNTPESPMSRSFSPEKPDDYPKVIEGLQMIQRTEVVLRVNTTTSDASSQTEKEELPPTPLPTRKKLQEEIECEKLSQDFVNHLPSSDRLKDLLAPGPEHKKPTDYVQGLFRVDVTLRPRPANSPFRSRNNTPSSSPPPTSTSSTSNITSTSRLSLPKTTSSPEPSSPLSCSSIYFTTSEPKAKFLTRYSQDMNQYHVVKDTKDLSQKKDELVNRLDKKLEVLRNEALIVSEECRVNDELGVNVENYINRLASPHEVSKFRLHVEEVGKITSLLLGLSGRLARAENALMNMQDDHPEKRILESKRDKLQDQLEEAKKLKECIDKRSISVSNILYKYLSSEEYADYDHFINMKAKLIMDSKEINDKIKLGEEQLGALKETLIIAD